MKLFFHTQVLHGFTWSVFHTNVATCPMCLWIGGAVWALDFWCAHVNLCMYFVTNFPCVKRVMWLKLSTWLSVLYEKWVWHSHLIKVSFLRNSSKVSMWLTRLSVFRDKYIRVYYSHFVSRVCSLSSALPCVRSTFREAIPRALVSLETCKYCQRIQTSYHEH